MELVMTFSIWKIIIFGKPFAQKVLEIATVTAVCYSKLTCFEVKKGMNYIMHFHHLVAKIK
jgi:hypothetical protein